MAFTSLTYQGEIPTSDSLNRALTQLQSQIDTLTAGVGTGTVTSVSIVTANGMSGTVATATTTPAITLVVGAINLATATGLPEAGLSLTNVTTNDVSITKHGFAPLLPNDATKYLDGTGAYTVPAGSGGGITIGTTAITSGTGTRLLYETSGNKVGEISGATSDGTTLTLVAPVLGTPASGTLTNCTGLPAAGVVGTAAILGANSFAAGQTITPAVNGVGLTFPTVTHTANAPAISIAQTWNNGAVSFTGIFSNVTNTASAGGSALMDLQVAGTPKFTVGKSGSVTMQGTLAVAGVGTFIQLDNGGGIFWNSRSTITSPADGVVFLGNNANNDFSRLTFGGTSSSFPSLKRSSAILQGRVADDSNFCQVQGLLTTAANAVTGLTAGVLAATTNASIVITDASGQAYRVPCII